MLMQEKLLSFQEKLQWRDSRNSLCQKAKTVRPRDPLCIFEIKVSKSDVVSRRKTLSVIVLSRDQEPCSVTE